LHHHLGSILGSNQIGLIVESKDPGEVHHLSMLVGFGENAIFPYLAIEYIWKLQIDCKIPLNNNGSLHTK